MRDDCDEKFAPANFRFGFIIFLSQLKRIESIQTKRMLNF